jgi:uroporphyrinogen III methyltransferase/synthase
VEHSFRALAQGGEGAATFGAARFAVVGTATAAALEAHGYEAQVVAKEFRGEGVAEALLAVLKRERGRGPRVLLLRAEEASDVLPEALMAAGVDVDVVAAYRTRPSPEGGAEIARLLGGGGLDVVVFSSGSTVTAICDALAPFGSPVAALATVTVVCLGPVTAAAAHARGLRVDLVPPVATFPAAIEALEQRFRAI